MHTHLPIHKHRYFIICNDVNGQRWLESPFGDNQRFWAGLGVNFDTENSGVAPLGLFCLNLLIFLGECLPKPPFCMGQNTRKIKLARTPGRCSCTFMCVCVKVSNRHGNKDVFDHTSNDKGLRKLSIHVLFVCVQQILSHFTFIIIKKVNNNYKNILNMFEMKIQFSQVKHTKIKMSLSEWPIAIHRRYACNICGVHWIDSQRLGDNSVTIR
ncbi:hypothetical protein AGLY_002762 [Aphis glycines]|uniref:Uncharacterized protein n=1 Tax=Aphis glycines TaxID=307491 RepID=A0A6G0U162_APHGL|nr:hypothetical protein AGLY_002762 [Aphis glycines]